MLLGVGGDLKCAHFIMKPSRIINGVIAVVTNTVGSLKENHLRTVIKLQIFFFKEEIWRVYKWEGARGDRMANHCQMGLGRKLGKQAGDYGIGTQLPRES